MSGAEIIGQSDAMRAVRRTIERVGPTDATVLIRGERGTGKELVATAIHQASRRRNQPSVAINCAALPPDLLASELFGHERGAFTGALQRSGGLLTAAEGGTVFLDEIGDLAPAGQAMLLRFLQEREVRPVGGRVVAKVDVRVVAATNVDLERAVRERTFRADLYDRLAEVIVRVPSLRERSGDIPLLVDHFLAVASRRHGARVREVSPAASALIARYSWPGNVRELEHAVTRAVIFAAGRSIQAADLGLPACDAERFGETSPDATDPACRLSPRQRAIAQLAALRGVLYRRDLTARYRISGEMARRELVTLVRLGILRRDGSQRGCRYAPVTSTPLPREDS